ncbi:MAG: extracellular solute-binding protein, partial [Geodermatophilaceae bacterium]|nr:extracellular solute-binding protein [Geodermatophilaceae bacterium]
MRRTPVVSVTLGLVGAIVLSACSSSGQTAAQGSDTVVFWDTSGAGESPVFLEVANGCAESGGYTVDVQTVAFDQARNNFKTAAQGGQGPDVMRAEVAWVAEFADAGLLVDLSDTSLAEDTSDFLEVPLASGTFDGKTYGIPQVTDTLALYYNRQMLEQAGVEPPQTWAEVQTVAAALGGQNTLFMNNDGYFALPFIYGAGGDLVDTD